MTDERKNEIWAFLTPKEKADIRFKYCCTSHSAKYDKGYNEAFEYIFGFDNLTSQAVEKPHTIAADDDAFEAYRRAKLDETTPKSPSHCENEPKMSVSESETTQESPSSVDYAQYRLDLAKEIAKVMFGDPSTFHYSEVPEFAVNAANEIVKRLKETEI